VPPCGIVPTVRGPWILLATPEAFVVLDEAVIQTIMHYIKQEPELHNTLQ